MFRGTTALALLLAALAFLACDDPSTTTAAPTATPTAAGPVLNSFRYNIRVEGTNLFPAPGFSTQTPGVPGAPGAPSPTSVATTAPSAPAVPLVLTETGEVNGPGAMRSRMTTMLGFLAIETERTRLDGRSWTRDGRGPWLEDRGGSTPANTSLGLGIDASTFVGPAAANRLHLLLRDQPSASDSVGGAQALRYNLTSVQIASLLGTPGPGAGQVTSLQGPWQLWVTADTRFPLRLTIDSPVPPDPQGRVRIEVNVTDHNTPITIQPPA